MEFYAINGFPTKPERKIICEFVGETDKRVQVILKHVKRNTSFVLKSCLDLNEIKLKIWYLEIDCEKAQNMIL